MNTQTHTFQFASLELTVWLKLIIHCSLSHINFYVEFHNQLNFQRSPILFDLFQLAEWKGKKYATTLIFGLWRPNYISINVFARYWFADSVFNMQQTQLLMRTIEREREKKGPKILAAISFFICLVSLVWITLWSLFVDSCFSCLHSSACYILFHQIGCRLQTIWISIGLTH